MITHLAPPPLAAGGEVTIEGDAYHHLFRARRLAAGVTLRVVDGRGAARWAEVVRVDRRRAVAVVGDEAPANEPPYDLTLVVAALKPERAAWLVEKATELGVAAVRFVQSERTPRRYGEGNLERLRRVAAAAVVQCHRSRLPEVSGVHPFAELEGLLADAAERFVLDPDGEPGEATSGEEAKSGAVLIGPEGGWSPAERDAFAGLGASPWPLGPRILRVETAALAAAAQLLLPSRPQKR